MLGIAAVALFANAISDAKAERKNDQKGNRGFHRCGSTSSSALGDLVCRRTK